MLWRRMRQSPWNPWGDLWNLHDEFNRAFGAYPWQNLSGEFPAVNVYESDKALELSMKLPGVKAKDLDISVNQDTLTLKGTRELDEAPKGAQYLRQERGEGSFVRSFALPFPVNTADVAAHYADCILTVRLPKAESAQPRKISIKAG
ncbi:MAG: Hsp20/alpha crystallin family protein [Lentisphaerae bacterium]|nr:Hsp20/alpha crystallin family protein [Lentisphaerota bacterium]